MMRRVRLPLLLLGMGLAGGCESLPEGALGEIGKTVLGDVAETAAATASVQWIQRTADNMCSSGDTMCRNLTMVAMSGFTQSFIDQLTKSDVSRMNSARERAMETGEAQEWSNPETGSRGRVETKPAPPKPPEPTPVKVKKNQVDSLPLMDAVGAPYVVSAGGGANVRGGPGTSFAVVEQLASNEKIQAISKVRDEPWYLVGRGSIGIGYVFGELLQKWTPPADEALDTGVETEAAVEEAEVDEVAVQMGSECFTTTHSVTLNDGSAEQATVTQCRTPDGWAQV